MYNVRRYSNAIPLCSWTNPEFKFMAILLLNLIKFDDQNTGPISSVIPTQ